MWIKRCGEELKDYIWLFKKEYLWLNFCILSKKKKVAYYYENINNGSILSYIEILILLNIKEKIFIIL